jgi:hypothetical protein
MRERARELKAEAGGDKTDGESALLAKIAEMPEPDRAMAKRLHALIKASAPALSSKTWYGMPAYAKAGKVVCFFQSAHKFKSRYATFGFNDTANLDEGAMWPTSFALKELIPRRRGSDRRAREESRELRTELTLGLTAGGGYPTSCAERIHKESIVNPTIKTSIGYCDNVAARGSWKTRSATRWAM